jgi:D-alanyl-lipoteichoic acid acyltransferase DltB (MBOAT superfamily)
MVFNSVTFLIFIAIFLPLYFALKGRARMWLCLLSSYLFYGWWDWRFLGLVMFTTILDFSLGIIIHESKSESKKLAMVKLSVLMNLGFLGFFKYFNFFIDSFATLLRSFGVEPAWHTLHILLPIGISFYTFQSMSYTIDVYRKEFEPERDFFRFATFVALFPQLVAGPIVRARHFLPQFREEKKFEEHRFKEGMTQIIWGFFKKVAIADTLAPFVDQAFGMPSMFSSMHLSIAVFFYSFQIYCDFSGYSNIACGLAQIMGFDFPWNFRTPYFSKNFSEFWTRWHISLSSWLRDYLYISLGGNRKGTFGTYRNLMLTMLIGGLWHGANWTFVFWGFLHGSYLVLQRLLNTPLSKVQQALPKIIWNLVAVLTVYLLTCFAWVFFRATNFTDAWAIIKGIVSLEGFSWGTVINKFLVMKGLILIGILLTAEIAHQYINLQAEAVKNTGFRIASLTILLCLLAMFGTFGAKSFIYFQF